ncbi:MAG: hypothetical protein JWM16_3508 [Verrucomicrobiales bacterium]|nr:hypothetical protein [Verrucomicrobiales bacterium]
MNDALSALTQADEQAASSMFIVVFKEHWENVRHIKNERLSFTNIYGIITAGTLSLMHSVTGIAALEFSLLVFLFVFSVIGLITSLRLRLELEECLRAIETMVRHAGFEGFMATDQVTGSLTRIPKFRSVFPIFYSITSVGFLTLLIVRLFSR